jgi:hypothetical protein
MSRQYPLPPFDRMRQGAVWRVLLEAPRQLRRARSWQEAWDGPPKQREHLIMVVGFGDLPTPHRTRLLVGDISGRPEKDILKDFRRILWQNPPVMRNWRKDFTKGTWDGQLWHLLWIEEVVLVA